MDHERKGFSMGRLLGTIALFVVLLFVIFIQIVIFVSGPAMHYEEKIATQIHAILQEHENIKELDRHVFAYVVYSGQDQDNYYWFNEQGALLIWRPLKDLDMESARAKAVEAYDMHDETVTLGYGYENPVYRIEDAETEVYLDIDTLEQIFVRKKGIQ